MPQPRLILESPLSLTPNTNIPLNRLPPEIREQIWLLTFSPRSLQIHTHIRRRIRKRTRAQIQQEKSSPVPQKAFLTFTASVIEHPDRGSSFCRQTHDWQRKAPETPVALHVCRESRVIALRRYELALGNVNIIENMRPGVRGGPAGEFPRAWSIGKIKNRNPKIWVDFKNDTFVIRETDRRYTALWDFAHFAPSEARRMERIGVIGWWGELRWYNIRADLCYGLGEYRSVKEVTIYDLKLDLESQTRNVSMGPVEGEEFEQTVEKALRQGALKVEEEAKSDFGQVREKENGKWMTKDPELKIIYGIGDCDPWRIGLN